MRHSLIVSLVVASLASLSLAVDLLFPYMHGLKYSEYDQAMKLGLTAHVCKDDDEWNSMTTADFAQYKAIIVPDCLCNTSVTTIKFLDDTKRVWSPAVTGNMVLIGTDPSFHAKWYNLPGAFAMMQDSIRHVAASKNGTGMYMSLSCYYQKTPKPTPIEALSEIGTFKVRGNLSHPCLNDAHMVATSSVMTSLNNEVASNWNCSVHEVITEFPDDFEALAIALNATGDGEKSFADGTSGIPYIVARGATPVGCGNSITEPAYKEECDDGMANGTPESLCSSSCRCILGMVSPGVCRSNTTSSSSATSSTLSTYSSTSFPSISVPVNTTSNSALVTATALPVNTTSNSALVTVSALPDNTTRAYFSNSSITAPATPAGPGTVTFFPPRPSEWTSVPQLNSSTLSFPFNTSVGSTVGGPATITVTAQPPSLSPPSASTGTTDPPGVSVSTPGAVPISSTGDVTTPPVTVTVQPPLPTSENPPVTADSSRISDTVSGTVTALPSSETGSSQYPSVLSDSRSVASPGTVVVTATAQPSDQEPPITGAPVTVTIQPPEQSGTSTSQDPLSTTGDREPIGQTSSVSDTQPIDPIVTVTATLSDGPITTSESPSGSGSGSGRPPSLSGTPPSSLTGVPPPGTLTVFPSSQQSSAPSLTSLMSGTSLSKSTTDSQSSSLNSTTVLAPTHTSLLSTRASGNASGSSTTEQSSPIDRDTITQTVTVEPTNSTNGATGSLRGTSDSLGSVTRATSATFVTLTGFPSGFPTTVQSLGSDSVTRTGIIIGTELGTSSAGESTGTAAGTERPLSTSSGSYTGDFSSGIPISQSSAANSGTTLTGTVSSELPISQPSGTNSWTTLTGTGLGQLPGTSQGIGGNTTWFGISTKKPQDLSDVTTNTAPLSFSSNRTASTTASSLQTTMGQSVVGNPSEAPGYGPPRTVVSGSLSNRPTSTAGMGPGIETSRKASGSVTETAAMPSASQCGSWVGIEVIVMVEITEVCPEGSTTITTLTSCVETLTRSICQTSTANHPCYPCIISTPTSSDHVVTITRTSISTYTGSTVTLTIQPCRTCTTSTYVGTVPGYIPGGPCHGCSSYPSDLHSVPPPIATDTLPADPTRGGPKPPGYGNGAPGNSVGNTPSTASTTPLLGYPVPHVTAPETVHVPSPTIAPPRRPTSAVPDTVVTAGGAKNRVGLGFGTLAGILLLL